MEDVVSYEARGTLEVVAEVLMPKFADNEISSAITGSDQLLRYDGDECSPPISSHRVSL